MNGDRVLYGWRVRSEFALEGLPPWNGDDRPPDVEVVLGDLPDRPEAPLIDRPHWQAWAGGVYRLTIAGVARYEALCGRRVVIEPAAGADANDIGVFLLGTMVGVLCHQRGLFPLHASAVRLDGRALMIAGASGAGKSTLAAALVRRGHPLLADDVVAVDCRRQDDVRVLPGGPALKLSLDVMSELGIDPSGLVVNRPGQPKYSVPARTGFDPAPLAPRALYLLLRVRESAPAGIERPGPAEAVARVDAMAYRRGVGLAITPSGTLFRGAAALVRAMPVHLLKVREEDPLSTLDDLAATVEAHARGLGGR